MNKVNKMIKEEQEKNKQNINFSEAIQDLKNGTYDQMMLGGKKQAEAEKAACGSAEKPCPADKSVCGNNGDKPCPVKPVCGSADHPCPAEPQA